MKTSATSLQLSHKLRRCQATHVSNQWSTNPGFSLAIQVQTLTKSHSELQKGPPSQWQLCYEGWESWPAKWQDTQRGLRGPTRNLLPSAYWQQPPPTCSLGTLGAIGFNQRLSLKCDWLNHHSCDWVQPIGSPQRLRWLTVMWLKAFLILLLSILSYLVSKTQKNNVNKKFNYRRKVKICPKNQGPNSNSIIQQAHSTL